jgi:hypothetical protein
MTRRRVGNEIPPRSGVVRDCDPVDPIWPTCRLSFLNYIEGLIDTINNGIWDLSDGELEDLAEVLGLDVKCFKHGIFFVKSLD